MNAYTPLPLDASADPADDLAAWGQGLLRRQAEMLEALSQAALRMAEAIERRVSEPPAEGAAPVAVGEAAMAFSRAARVARMSALLQSRLIADLQALEASPARQAALAKAAGRGDPAYVHKARVEGVVERVAKAACGEDEDRLERLMVEAAERLDDDDIYGEVLSRPVGELVALLCRDLDLQPDWSRLAQEAWAKAEIEGGDPRSPFMGLAPITTSPIHGGGGPPAEERAVERAGGWRSLDDTPFQGSS